MDIQFAYNLERMLYYILDEDPVPVKKYMSELELNEGSQLDQSVVEKMKEVFVSCSVSDQETLVCSRGVCPLHVLTCTHHGRTP
jgi:hypothetical protein